MAGKPNRKSASEDQYVAGQNGNRRTAKRPRYVNEMISRHGKRFLYFRKGDRRERLPLLPYDHPEFIAAYEACLIKFEAKPAPDDIRKRRKRLLRIIERMCAAYKTDELNADLIEAVIQQHAAPMEHTLGTTGAIPHHIRWKIYNRDGFQCILCGAEGVEMTLDHIHPLSKGGTNSPNNLQTVCRPCNSRKYDMLPSEI